jgi:hypothetical protein
MSLNPICHLLAPFLLNLGLGDYESGLAKDITETLNKGGEDVWTMAQAGSSQIRVEGKENGRGS